MIVIHVESGLGNQMLSYCEYLIFKKLYPDRKIYIETIVFDLVEAGTAICQWNGYELENIFGIKAPNIQELFSAEQWNGILQVVEKSRFWEKYWNYPPYIVKALSQGGLELSNIRGDFEKNPPEFSIASKKQPLSYKLKQSGIYENIRRIYYTIKGFDVKKNDRKYLFYDSEDPFFTGQRLTLKNRNNNIEFIQDEIRDSFVFPAMTDQRNIDLAFELQHSNSVAVHARRGDMLSVNGKYYRSGFFKRAVKLIKKNVENPEFYFFCDPGSIEWCTQNQHIFGLNMKKDSVHFVDWNKGKESYRDMQLMAMCKHNVITNSSFGWWGAYLNSNPDKITVSPELMINTTHHC